MQDLRLVFKNLMQKWGTNVYLQRKNYAAVAQGPYKDAPNHGYSVPVERWTIRMHIPGRGSTRLASTRNEEIEGIVTDVDMIFYFPWDSNPKEQDRIYVSDDRYNVPTNTDYSGHELYVVEYAMPMRGWGGRIEFYEVGAVRKDPN